MPAASCRDGVLRIAQDAAESAYSLDHIRRFIFEGLNRFDKSELKSMGMAHYFHTQVHLFSQFGIDLFERMRQQVAIR